MKTIAELFISLAKLTNCNDIFLLSIKSIAKRWIRLRIASSSIFLPHYVQIEFTFFIYIIVIIEQTFLVSHNSKLETTEKSFTLTQKMIYCILKNTRGPSSYPCGTQVSRTRGRFNDCFVTTTLRSLLDLWTLHLDWECSHNDRQVHRRARGAVARLLWTNLWIIIGRSTSSTVRPPPET